jgi:4-aminobutyrate aminotransferase-like enzyme
MKSSKIVRLFLACLLLPALQAGAQAGRAEPQKPEAAGAIQPAAPAAEAAQDEEKQKKAEARRQAQVERAAAEKKLREDLIAACVIKPVMTDEEIAKCRIASGLGL